VVIVEEHPVAKAAPVTKSILQNFVKKSKQPEFKVLDLSNILGKYDQSDRLDLDLYQAIDPHVPLSE
jgi:hypothetical protein